VSVADVDEEGNVDPYQIKDRTNNDFKWDEVWALLSSTEVLMLATFFTLNSVCCVYSLSTLNTQLNLVNSNAAEQFSAVYSVASLNVFLFAFVLQNYGFTVG